MRKLVFVCASIFLFSWGIEETGDTFFPLEVEKKIVRNYGQGIEFSPQEVIEPLASTRDLLGRV